MFYLFSFLIFFLFLIPTLSFAGTYPFKEGDIFLDSDKKVSSGWKLTEKATGHFNADKYLDIAAIYESNMKGKSLVIMEGIGQGEYKIVSQSHKLLEGHDCGYTPWLEVRKNVIRLIWDDVGASRTLMDYSIKLRRDKKLNKYILIGEDYDEFDRLDGKGILYSINHITGSKMTKQYRWAEKKVFGKPERKEFSQKKVAVEDIDFKSHENLVSYCY